MKHNLKPIGDQVIVITGASSGIGLATAYAAAERGAKVVLAARNKAALNQAVAKIKAAGGEAIAVQTDVSQQAQVQALADAAIRAYGGFDTWVNNAGVGIYALAEEVPDNEHRRPIRRELFRHRVWKPGRGGASAAAGRVADQPGEHPVRDLGAAAGSVLREQGGGAGVYRFAADRAAP